MLLRVTKYLVMCTVSLIGVLTNISLMSNIINLQLLCVTHFIKFYTNKTEFIQLYILGDFMKLLSVFIKNFAVLYVSELVLFTAGLIGILGLCVFRHAISLRVFV
jgi:hypothetical protein